MKKISLKIILLISILTVLITGCQQEDLGESITTLVKGRMDAVYTGEASEEYMNLTGTTLIDIEENHKALLRKEAIRFCNFTGILEGGDESAYMALSEETRSSLEDMCSRVYDKVSYEVRDPEKESDGSYSVEVTVTPVDVFSQIAARLETGDFKPYADFEKKYNTEATPQDTFSEDLAAILIQLVDEVITTASAPPSKGFVLDITNDEGNLSISPEAWDSIDKSLIIYS